MKGLALDFGTKFGFYEMDTDNPEEGTFGEIELKGDKAERFLEFERWLDTALDGVEFVVYEEVRFGGRRFSYIPGQMSLTMLHCLRRNIAFVGVGVKELKKWSTGNGNANKELMKEAAAERLGFNPNRITDNEADAVLAGFWAQENVMV